MATKKPRKRTPKKAVVVNEVPLEADMRIERGLMAVAAHNGNTRKAAAFLAEDGIKVDHSTLWEWARKRHVKRYEELRAEILPQIRAQAADQHMDLAGAQMEANKLIVERLKGEVDEIPSRDLPGASRNMSVGAAVETEKAQLLNDQPTEIRKHRDASEIIKSLKARGVLLEATVISEETIEPVQLEETVGE